MLDKTNEEGAAAAAVVSIFFFSLRKNSCSRSRRKSWLHISFTANKNNKIWLFWTWFLLFSWTFQMTSSYCPPFCTCNDVALSVDCQSAGNLQMVPIVFNPQTKFLSLASNQINEISMSFQFYSELQLLDFSQNKLETIGQNNFENLRNLRVLNSSYNAIRSLEPDVFLGLKNLQVLDLSVNQIEKVEKKVLNELKNLKELILDRNRLDMLEWDLFQGLQKLEKLSAKFNFLRTIQPPTSISTQRLLSSEGVWWTLSSLQELDVSWNQLTRVKDYGLSVFSSLQTLNLCCNYIHTLEEKAFEPFFNLSTHPDVGYSSQLTFVNLSQNRLGRIPTDSLEKLESLVELDLSSNGLSEQLPSHSFKGLFKLQKLRLSDNPSIISIHPDALIDNINLVEVEFDHLSNLTEFETGLFNNKPFLEKFSLQFSQISQIPEEAFQNPQYSSLVSTLSLLGIQLDCNCSAYPLFSWIIAQQGSSSPSSDDSSSSSSSQQPTSKIHNNNTNSNNNNKTNTGVVPGIPNESANNKNEISAKLLHQSHLMNQKQQQQQQLQHHRKRRPPRLLIEQLVCMSPPSLAGVHLKDLSSSDFEQCFDHFPLLFASENFEILVIILACIIVGLILLVLGIKLCCVYEICAKCALQFKNRRRRRQQQHKKDVTNGDGIIIGVDEFCSNFNTKSFLHEYPLMTTVVSPELVSKIQKTVHLNNSSLNNSNPVNNSSVAGVENNGLLTQLSTLKKLSTMNSNNSSSSNSRYSNGYVCNNNGSNSILRNNNGQSLSTMTSGLSSNMASTTLVSNNPGTRTERDDEDSYGEDEDQYYEEEDEDEEDDNYNTPYQQIPRQPHQPHQQLTNKRQQLNNYTRAYTVSNNKLRFDPKLQLPYEDELEEELDKRSTLNSSRHHHAANPLQPYLRHHGSHTSNRSNHIPSLPSTPPPPVPSGIMLHYEYDYPDYPQSKSNNSSSSVQSRHHHHLSQRSHHPPHQHTNGRIKQVPSVLV